MIRVPAAPALCAPLALFMLAACGFDPSPIEPDLRADQPSVTTDDGVTSPPASPFDPSLSPGTTATGSAGASAGSGMPPEREPPPAPKATVDAGLAEPGLPPDPDAGGAPLVLDAGSTEPPPPPDGGCPAGMRCLPFLFSPVCFAGDELPPCDNGTCPNGGLCGDVSAGGGGPPRMSCFISCTLLP